MILSTRHGIFVQQAIDLATTIVVKHSFSAKLIGDTVMTLSNVDETMLPMEEWRYYMSIAGEYHSLDTVMYVTSLDTYETIAFTKENLAVHSVTAKEYQYGTSNYKDLVTRYPGQETLILGILYPADKAAAIAAEDGTIVAYPPQLVESNEYSLISNLQKWVTNYLGRWYNPSYNLTDNMYHSVTFSMMHMLMVNAVLNFRLRACKTLEAHSFHVFHYLASHGLNQFYLPLLTTPQMLWLYRNICYLEKHAGNTENFYWLIENLLTARGIPLAEFSMRHNLENMPETGTLALDSVPMFYRNALNLSKKQLGDATLTLENMLAMEDGVAQDNYDERYYNTTAINNTLLLSKSDKLPTKALHSYMADYSTSGMYPLEWIMLNHWIYAACHNLIKPQLVIKHPKTGQDFVVSPREAVALYFYAFYAQYGSFGVEFPTVYLHRVTRDPKPSMDDLLSVVDLNYVTVDEVTEIRNSQPLLTTFNSTAEFDAFCNNLFSYEAWQLRWVTNHHHDKRRAVAENLVSRMYCDMIVDVGEGLAANYQAWFNSRDFSTDNMTSDDWSTFADYLFQLGCGYDRTAHVSERSIQQAMLALTAQLSSYSIQFLSTIIDSQVIFSKGEPCRADDFNPDYEGNNDLELIPTDARGFENEMINEATISDLTQVEAQYNMVVNTGCTVDPNVGINPSPIVTKEIPVELLVTRLSPETSPTLAPDLDVPGMLEFFVNVPQELLKRVPNAYCDCRMVEVSTEETLYIYKNKLDVFSWLPIPIRMLDYFKRISGAVSLSGFTLFTKPIIADGYNYLGKPAFLKGVSLTAVEISTLDSFKYYGVSNLKGLAQNANGGGLTQQELSGITPGDLLNLNGFYTESQTDIGSYPFSQPAIASGVYDGGMFQLNGLIAP